MQIRFPLVASRVPIRTYAAGWTTGREGRDIEWHGLAVIGFCNATVITMGQSDRPAALPGLRYCCAAYVVLRPYGRSE